MEGTKTSIDTEVRRDVRSAILLIVAQDLFSAFVVRNSSRFWMIGIIRHVCFH